LSGWDQGLYTTMCARPEYRGANLPKQCLEIQAKQTVELLYKRPGTFIFSHLNLLGGTAPMQL
jgi:hypothetical protein